MYRHMKHTCKKRNGGENAMIDDAIIEDDICVLKKEDDDCDENTTNDAIEFKTNNVQQQEEPSENSLEELLKDGTEELFENGFDDKYKQLLEMNRILMADRKKMKKEFEEQLKKRERERDDDYEKLKKEISRQIDQNIPVNNNTIKNNTIKSNTIKNNRINNINNVNNNVNNNVVINNNNMQLIGYGKEDLSKIDPKEILSAMNHGYDIVLKLTEVVHFNPKHPEFHNLCITNTKDQYGMMYDGNTWTKLTKKELLNRVYGDKKDYVEDTRDEFIDKLQPSRKRALDNWLAIDNDEHERIQQTKTALKLLMYNKRHIVNMKTSAITPR